MKVNIGDYKSGRTGSYQVAQFILRLFFCKNRNIITKFSEFIPAWPFKFLENRKQKVQIKIDDWDIYNADYTLSLIIVAVLNKFKEEKTGAPFVEDSDVPEEIKATSSNHFDPNDGSDDFWDERWQYVLDEMIFAFEYDAKDQFEFNDEVYERVKKGRILFAKYYNGLWS